MVQVSDKVSSSGLDNGSCMDNGSTSVKSNNEVNASVNGKEVRRLGHSLLIGLFILITALLGSAAAYASGMKPESVKHADAYEDFEWLRLVMDEIQQGDVSLTASQFAIIPWSSDFESSIDRIRSALSSLPGNWQVQQEGNAWIGSKPLSKETSLLVSAQEQSDHIVLVVQLQSTKLEDNIEYERWFSKLNEAWTELGQRPDWRVNLQASLEAELQPEDVWVALDRAGVEAALSVDDYRDNGTISKTYHVPFLYSSVEVKGQSVQLQAGIHQSSVDQAYRVTLGTPLITIEY